MGALTVEVVTETTDKTAVMVKASTGCRVLVTVAVARLV
jgi:hypothetical protein